MNPSFTLWPQTITNEPKDKLKRKDSKLYPFKSSLPDTYDPHLKTIRDAKIRPYTDNPRWKKRLEKQISFWQMICPNLKEIQFWCRWTLGQKIESTLVKYIYPDEILDFIHHSKSERLEESFLQFLGDNQKIFNLGKVWTRKEIDESFMRFFREVKRPPITADLESGKYDYLPSSTTIFEKGGGIKETKKRCGMPLEYWEYEDKTLLKFLKQAYDYYGESVSKLKLNEFGKQIIRIPGNLGDLIQIRYEGKGKLRKAWEDIGVKDHHVPEINRFKGTLLDAARAYLAELSRKRLESPKITKLSRKEVNSCPSLPSYDYYKSNFLKDKSSWEDLPMILEKFQEACADKISTNQLKQEKDETQSLKLFLRHNGSPNAKYEKIQDQSSPDFYIHELRMLVEIKELHNPEDNRSLDLFRKNTDRLNENMERSETSINKNGTFLIKGNFDRKISPNQHGVLSKQIISLADKSENVDADKGSLQVVQLSQEGSGCFFSSRKVGAVNLPEIIFQSIEGPVKKGVQQLSNTSKGIKVEKRILLLLDRLRPKLDVGLFGEDIKNFLNKLCIQKQVDEVWLQQDLLDNTEKHFLLFPQKSP